MATAGSTCPLVPPPQITTRVALEEVMLPSLHVARDVEQQARGGHRHEK